jgi:hypothetical protein
MMALEVIQKWMENSQDANISCRILLKELEQPIKGHRIDRGMLICEMWLVSFFSFICITREQGSILLHLIVSVGPIAISYSCHAKPWEQIEQFKTLEKRGFMSIRYNLSATHMVSTHIMSRVVHSTHLAGGFWMNSTPLLMLPVRPS